MNALRLVVALPFLCLPLCAQGGYRLPPQAIVDCIDAPLPPSVRVSPDRARLLLVARESMPSIAVQSRPVLRLAGVRFDPRTRGPQRGARETGLALLEIASGTRREVALPEGVDIGWPTFSADGQRLAFANTTEDRIELWIADVGSARARRIDGVALNATLGTPLEWMPDQRTLLCRLVPEGAGAPPEQPAAPSGPSVQQTAGKVAPVRTYQDLLQNEHDAALFEHYARAQLALVDTAGGAITRVGAPALWTSAAPSPDGTMLLTSRVERPFSYLVPYRSFPTVVAVLGADGEEIYRVAAQPLAEDVPIGGVEEGPRAARWIPSEDHTLLWVEALDGGDPRKEAEHRDRVVVHTPPQRSAPREWLRLELRYAGAAFAEGGDLALVSETDRFHRRWTRTWKVSPGDLGAAPALLFERSTQDAYGDPGRPLSRLDPRGNAVLQRDGDAVFFEGNGATPQGDRPFLDRWDLASGDKTRVFVCGDNVYEEVGALLRDDGTALLVRRESQDRPPNFFVREANGDERALTTFTDPFAELTAKIEKRLVHYERADGIPLSAKLCLPPGHEPGTRLPLLVWAYPREFDSADNAGQVRGSPYRYERLAGTSPLLLTLCGYAVMDDAAMPIVGPVETANDTFIEQLVAGARAAVEKAAALGVADPERAAIAGHSYGAFMTANLLAHSDLFRAGIARSGAYNRTLTPFGFQNERRTFWEAPEIYFAMSPFMHAQEIDEPLLLIHGEMDNNSGTFPLQSRRLFHAIKGHGGTARLVMLPYESHGYRARESVLHCMAEMVDWLDQHVKNAAPRAPATEAANAAGPRDGGR